MQNITLGQYFVGDSCVHRVDPRMKILLTVAYIVMVFLTQGPLGYLVLTGAVFGICTLARIPVRYLLRGLRSVLFIVIFTFLLNLFFTKGEQLLLSFWIVKIYKEGITTAVFFSLRLIFLVLGTSLLTLTTSSISLTDGLERLLSPLKKVRFPVHEVSMMMTIALRFIPTLMEETDKIMKAQTARGADFNSGNLFAKVRAMIPLLVPLFVSAFRRADELAMAMEARCYRGDVGRTRMKVLKMTVLDLYAALFMAAVLGLILLERLL